MLKEHCECGGSIQITGPMKEQVLELFRNVHKGPGHQERVTPLEAEKAREEVRSKERQKERTANNRAKIKQAHETMLETLAQRLHEDKH